MAVIGAHMLLYTPEPDALRAMLRDVFGLKHVDAGEGWLSGAAVLPVTLRAVWDLHAELPDVPVVIERQARPRLKEPCGLDADARG